VLTQTHGFLGKRFAQVAKVLGIGAFLIAVFGCASGPVSDANLDQQAKAFGASPGMAAIYIYRPTGVWGAALLFGITVDDNSRGVLGPGNFLVIEVEPGAHNVYGEFNMSELGTPGETIPVYLEIDTAPDRLYFVKHDVKVVRMTNQLTLDIVDEPTGRKAIQGSKLVNWVRK
jgi:hypothetical protein